MGTCLDFGDYSQMRVWVLANDTTTTTTTTTTSLSVKARAAQLWRWENSNNCTGDKQLLNTDAMDQCSPFHFPAPASILVLQKNDTAYSSYHYGPGGEPGTTNCTGARSLLADWIVGTCVAYYGNYSQMRVWVTNADTAVPLIV